MKRSVLHETPLRPTIRLLNNSHLTCQPPNSPIHTTKTDHLHRHCISTQIARSPRQQTRFSQHRRADLTSLARRPATICAISSGSAAMEVDSRTPSAGPRRRGGARSSARGRADRDGDMKMDLAIKGRSRIGKASAPPGPASTRKRDALNSRATKGGILSSTAQRAILRQAANKDVSMKDSRGASTGLLELKITGWEKSKAVATSKDGGVSALIKWLEKKASLRLGSGRRDVKIKKVRRHRLHCCHYEVTSAQRQRPMPGFCHHLDTY